MKSSTFISLLLAITFIWAGFLAAISFMEAPVKFTAPSLTLAIGLDVGRHVFAALNKAEWFFTGISAFLLFKTKPAWGSKMVWVGVYVILFVQTFWLLPALDARALVYITGNTPPASHLHISYIIIEAIKLAGLIVAGCLQVVAFRKAVESEILSQNNIETVKKYHAHL